MPTNEKPAYVYMLLCGDGSLYTGITTDMHKRMRDHVNKTAACAKYTRHRTVTALAAAWQTTNMTAPVGWNGRCTIPTVPPRTHW